MSIKIWIDVLKASFFGWLENWKIFVAVFLILYFIFYKIGISIIFYSIFFYLGISLLIFLLEKEFYKKKFNFWKFFLWSKKINNFIWVILYSIFSVIIYILFASIISTFLSKVNFWEENIFLLIFMGSVIVLFLLFYLYFYLYIFEYYFVAKKKMSLVDLISYVVKKVNQNSREIDKWLSISIIFILILGYFLVSFGKYILPEIQLFLIWSLTTFILVFQIKFLKSILLNEKK